MERDVFLARVGRASLGSGLPEVPRIASELPQPAPVDLVSLFRARAQEVNAVVHGPLSRHGVHKVVLAVAAGHDATKFMVWDDLPAPGVASALESVGIQRIGHDTSTQGRLNQNMSYADIDVGVTGASAGLAESGSVVLTHGPGRPRMASIAPDIHVALLEVSTITRTLAHWAHENPDIVADTTNLVVVTGPSRTADIEQQLNLGVHGPRHVHIVMIR